MIKAQELRIGNYVQYEELKNPSKVWIIDCTETSTSTKAKPIPLTEEWLLKFGFIKSENILKFFLYNNFEVYIQDNVFWYDLTNDSIVIENVHQLQNLYFALTSYELTIKEANNEQ